MSREIYNKAVAVVVKSSDGKFLLGNRIDGQGWSTAGGKSDRGETLNEAASRELFEELGLIVCPEDLIYLGDIISPSISKGIDIITISAIYECPFSVSLFDTSISEFSECNLFTLREALTLDKLFIPTFIAFEKFYVNNPRALFET